VGVRPTLPRTVLISLYGPCLSLSLANEYTVRVYLYKLQIHGDLHPGNILISRNARDQLVMTMLDCGLVIEFGPKQHETVVKILGAFTRRQGRNAAQLMVDNASKCQANELDVELFIKGIEQIIVEDAEQVRLCVVLMCARVYL
jgi:predicted unusual protein kinase regulating ubiquinone biosynthesis (AarF/ABC1/UbiB family)